MTKCIAKTIDGQPCSLKALADSRDGQYCYRHDPDREEVRRQNSKRGGRPKKITLLDALSEEEKALIQHRNVRTVQNVIEILGEAIGFVMAQKLNATMGQTIAKLSATLLSALKMLPEEEQAEKSKQPRCSKDEAVKRIRELYGMTPEPLKKSEDVN